MLPDLRAVLAATIATVGLSMLAFGAVAAFRVAQGSHGALQADLTKRTHMAELAPPARHPVRVIDTPGPHIAPFPPLPIREVKDAPIASVVVDLPGPAEAAAPVAPAEPAATAPAPAVPPVAAAAPPAPPGPAIGGPFAEPRTPTDAERAAAKAERARKLAAAKKARAARLARQRKAAARRAALARAKLLQSQQATTSFNNNFGNPGFGGGFGQQPAQASARKTRPATARSDTPFSPGGQQ
ncbi:MAG: hypothetical protein JO000_16250 [Alphaproteobacteria bacterium]|nr:hypothetical protein [Alphaproteobacteria bacterium]